MNSQVNIYKNRGEWCYALFTDGTFDSSDTIGVDNDATEQEARAALNDSFVFGGKVTMTRVEDTEITSELVEDDGDEEDIYATHDYESFTDRFMS